MLVAAVVVAVPGEGTTRLGGAAVWVGFKGGALAGGGCAAGLWMEARARACDSLQYDFMRYAGWVWIGIGGAVAGAEAKAVLGSGDGGTEVGM